MSLLSIMYIYNVICATYENVKITADSPDGCVLYPANKTLTLDTLKTRDIDTRLA